LTSAHGSRQDRRAPRLSEHIDAVLRETGRADTMTKRARPVLTAVLILLSTTARGQDRRKFVPVRVTAEPVTLAGPFDGGTVPVERPHDTFDFTELNDEFELDRDSPISLIDGIEKILDIRSPALTTKWNNFSPVPATTQFGLIDPQIAASNSIVGVLLWDTLGWYDKSGTLLPSTPSFPNPTSTEVLFKPLVDWLDANANLNPDVAGDSTFLFANGQVGDARIAWDPQRQRFLILGTAKNNASHPSATTAEAISQRRTKFIFAMSKTADPHDGFYTWAFNGTPNDGACNSKSDASPCPNSFFTPGDAGDYPSIGISSFHYVFTSHVEHANVSGSGGFSRTSYIVTVNAAAAAAGNTAGLHGHGFWGFNNPKADPSEPDVKSIGIIATAVQRTPLPGGDGNLLAQVVNGGGSKRVVTYFITPTDPPHLSGQAFDLPSTIGTAVNAPQPSPGQPLNYGSNLLSNIITAYWRDGILYTSFADCVEFADMASGCADAVHIVKFQADANTVSYHGGLIFGERNPLDEPPGTVNHYAFPGTAVNKHHNLVVTFTRTGATLPPEARYSVWYKGEAQQRPSNVLQAGTGDQPSNGNGKGYRDDTAGVAVDPFDDTSIWIAHSYANNGGVGWAVGKVFGSRYFDLSVENISVLQEVAVVGGTARASFQIVNRGDGAAPGARGVVTLVDTEGRARRVDATRVEPLDAGAAQATEVAFTVPIGLPPGPYRVCVALSPDGGEREYSEDNDRGCSASTMRVVNRLPTEIGPLP
jgi:hypothetical protein